MKKPNTHMLLVAASTFQLLPQSNRGNSLIHLDIHLELERCPHCSVAKPYLYRKTLLPTENHSGGNKRYWGVYICNSCGGLITASSKEHNGVINEIYPEPDFIDEDIPEKPRAFLIQAMETLHAPAGAIMLSASAIDSMLKSKGYTEGSLYERIELAAESNLITQEMAKWAHEIRLDANDQRHADESAELPTTEDAERIFDFASALAEFLFVLPSQVQRGIKNSN